jgi:glycopeptide antibiotics resistance protein
VGWVLSMTLRADSTLNILNLVPLREHAQAVVCPLNDCPDAARSARFLFIDVAGNVVVFVPIGLALSGALGGALDRRGLWLAVALCMALSIGIELVQLLLLSQRCNALALRDFWAGFAILMADFSTEVRCTWAGLSSNL